MIFKKKRTIPGILIVIFSSICAPFSTGQDISQIQIKTIPLAEGMYMLVGAGGNIGVSSGEEGILLIDSQFGEVSEKIKAALSDLSGGPIKFVLNTNWHYDHVSGNGFFSNEGAVIVAHEKTRERMASEQFYPDFDMKNPAYPEQALPKICVSDSMTLHFNGDEIQILHVENAHSDADLIFYFQKANVLHTGDILFSEGYPYIDAPSGGSITGMIQAAKKILGMINEDTKIIPGHGQLAGKKDLEHNVKVLTTIRDRIQGLIGRGKSLEEIIASKPTEDLDKENSGGMEPDFFITIVYNDLTGKYK
jgi:cyclase